jgi:hypothetical protein
MTETTNRDSLLLDDVGRHNATPGDNPSKVEHPNGVQVVGGSNPLGPTSRKPSSYLEEGFLVAFGGSSRMDLTRLGGDPQ